MPRENPANPNSNSDSPQPNSGEPTVLDRLKPYLNDGDLLEEIVAANGKDAYMMPARRNAGHIAVALIREAIAPTVFRNAEEEITDFADHEETRRVRAVPAKFKFGERGRGLMVLRAFGVGGRLPQNRTAAGPRMEIGKAFDLNTFVFGDSAMHGTRVLPVKAAVQYSDALSVRPYGECVSDDFHNRSDESGTLFDAEKKVNSTNLFTRHYIRPGTLLVQTLSANGRQLPPIGFDHLFLCLGLAGAYGGQTSVTGVNIRTHIAGVFASRLEKPLSSPYELLKSLPETDSVDTLAAAITDAMADGYTEHAGRDDASAHRDKLVEAFERDDRDLRERYEQAAPEIAEMFERYFGPGKEKGA